MSSFLNTTATITHTTPIPAPTPASRCIGLLHDPEFFIKINPHMIAYSVIPTPTNPSPSIPPERGAVALGPPTRYQVTDKVHALPAGIWDSEVVSTYEFMQLERGLFVRIRSPLSIVMEMVWDIKETQSGGLELVEEVVIKCSRLLVGFMKSTCESDWKGIHGSMVKKMEGKD